MPESCTCGAVLPPDSLFCHKCGKPQRDLPAVEVEAPVPPPAADLAAEPMPPLAPTPVNFRNMDALKTALMAAVMATFLFFLPYVNWLAAGYLSVLFYRRRTRQTVNIVSGVRIGWLTGLMTFAILAVLMCCSSLVLRSPGAMEMMKAMAQKDSSVQQLLGIMQNGPQLTGLLATMFVFVTFLSMTGGLLGAVLAGSVNRRPRGGNSV